MGSVSRGTKLVGGGTNFSGGKILASEVNTDFNTIYTDYNGNIKNANLAADAQIEISKMDGYSDTATERNTQTDPGTAGAESDATNMAGEIERLRFKLKQIGTGTSTKRLDGTAGVDLVSWIDTPQTGPNLIRNGNFAVKTTAAGSAPDGWALVNTPDCDLTTAGVTEGHSTMRALRVGSTGAGLEGISQTLVGLKANTKYVIGCRVKVNAGGDVFRLLTTGADNAVAAFDDLALDTSSATYTTVAGVIITDGTPTDIVVQLLAVAASDSFDVTHCWVRECATDKIPMSNTAWAYEQITTVTANHYGAGVLTSSGLSGVSVVCPGPGYVIEVVGAFDLADDSSNGNSFFGQLRENGVGVQTSSCQIGDDGSVVRDCWATCHINYVNLNPTPGTTYTYTLFGASLAGHGNINRNHVAASGETPIATWIRCRAVLESGGH